MLPILKVTAIGGACAGLLCFAWWASGDGGIPPCRDLSSDNDFNIEESGAYHNKYASDYSKYFVGVSAAKTGTAVSSIDNDPWWEWVFLNKYQTYSKAKKQGFTNKNTAKDLKEACKAAYKTETGKVVNSDSSKVEVDESAIWAFCSIGGIKPKSIFEVKGKGSSSESFEGNETDAKLLISTTDINNDWFWQIKEAEFFGASNYPTGLGDENSNDSTFKNTYNNQKEQYKDLTHMKVKELCGQAYSNNSSTSQAFPRKAVFKFCSLSGKEPPAPETTSTKGSGGVTSTGEQTGETPTTEGTSK